MSALRGKSISCFEFYCYWLKVVEFHIEYVSIRIDIGRELRLSLYLRILVICSYIPSHQRSIQDYVSGWFIPVRVISLCQFP